MNTERLRNDEYPESAAQRFYAGDWSLEDRKTGLSFGPPPPPAPASFWGYCNTSLPFWMRTTVLADRGNQPEPANWAFPHNRLNCGQRGGTGFDAGNSMPVFEDMKADGPGSEEYIETAVFVQYKITTQRKTCPAASTAAGAALGYWAAVEVAFTIIVVIVLGSTGLINEPDGAGKLGLKGLAKSGSRAATAKPATTEDMARLRADIMAALEGKQPTKPAEGATSTAKGPDVVVQGV